MLYVPYCTKRVMIIAIHIYLCLWKTRATHIVVLLFGCNLASPVSDIDSAKAEHVCLVNTTYTWWSKATMLLKHVMAAPATVRKATHYQAKCLLHLNGTLEKKFQASNPSLDLEIMTTPQ